MISASAYDRLGGDEAALPDNSWLPDRLPSPFFTADVVVTEEGRPYLLEVGDGGSSALPPAVAAADFHVARALARALAVAAAGAGAQSAG